MTTRIILIGAGNIAHHHLQAFRLAGAEVVGVCTRGTSGPEFAQQYGIPHCAHSVTELVETTNPDAALILTHPTQYQTILETLKPYNLPVLIEKPLGLSEEMALALQPVLPDTVFVGFNRRFYGNIQAIRPLLEDRPPYLAQLIMPERLKDFMHRDPETRNRWHVLNEIHGIDLISYLSGSLQKLLYRTDWGHIEDLALSQYYSCIYQSNQNHHIHFMANYDSPGGWRMHFFLKQMEIICSPLEKTLIKTLSGVEELPTSPDDIAAKPGFLQQAKTFLSGLQSPQNLPQDWVGFDQGLTAIRMTETLLGQTAPVTLSVR